MSSVASLLGGGTQSKKEELNLPLIGGVAVAGAALTFFAMSFFKSDPPLSPGARRVKSALQSRRSVQSRPPASPVYEEDEEGGEIDEPAWVAEIRAFLRVASVPDAAADALRQDEQLAQSTALLLGFAEFAPLHVAQCVTACANMAALQNWIYANPVAYDDGGGRATLKAVSEVCNEVVESLRHLKERLRRRCRVDVLEDLEEVSGDLRRMQSEFSFNAGQDARLAARNRVAEQASAPVNSRSLKNIEAAYKAALRRAQARAA